MFWGMKELTGPDTAPALLELSMWPPHATPRPLQYTSVKESVGLGPRGLVREGLNEAQWSWGFSVGSEAQGAWGYQLRKTQMNNIRAFHLPTKQKC